MTESSEELSRQSWQDFLESLTKEHAGTNVTMELLSADYGDQYEAEQLPFTYIEYDPKDDVVIIAVGGRDSRYPVLRHIIARPQKVLVAAELPDTGPAVEVTGGDGSQTLITFHRPFALEP
jgi:hypothetical protein